VKTRRSDKGSQRALKWHREFSMLAQATHHHEEIENLAVKDAALNWGLLAFVAAVLLGGLAFAILNHLA
jgi:hypothetical protein